MLLPNNTRPTGPIRRENRAFSLSVLLETKLSQPKQGLGYMRDNLDGQYIFRKRTNPSKRIGTHASR